MRIFHYTAFLVACFTLATSDERTHIYAISEEVQLWMNTVGPYNNMQETYEYYFLPFCAGSKMTINYYHETLGESLLGFNLQPSGLQIAFKVNSPETAYCEIKLNEARLEALMYTVKNRYWYQMYLDDLPIWGNVGEYDKSDNSYYLWTDKKFDIFYHENQIVEVNLRNERSIKLEKVKLGQTIMFTYEVNWKASSVEFENRFDKYLEPAFFSHKMHWFSILNCFILVVFLGSLVTIIILRNYAKVEEEDDMKTNLVDEPGWKQLCGDVFRPPSCPMLFSVLIGSGAQISITVLFVAVFSILGELYTARGSVLSASIFVYTATSPFNGFFGGSLYSRIGGKRWIKQMMYGTFSIPCLICGGTWLINFASMYYHTSWTIQFGSMVDVMCICIFVILPLMLVGTVLGRKLYGKPSHPCSIHALPSPIPKKRWYMAPAIIACLGGMLSFGCIFIEIFFIFSSLWTYKIYYTYGFFLLVFIMLALVNACLTIVFTHYLLNAGGYKWQWTSFFSGASTAVYVYIFSVYYFCSKTDMDGLFQTTFYFGYMALFSVIIGIVCGTFGYVGASLFVQRIYSSAKINRASIFILPISELKFESKASMKALLQ